MLAAMGLAAFLCIFIGSQPQYLYALLPWEVDYWPYDLTHVLTQTQLLFFSALAFVWLNKQGLYPPELHSVNLDMEWFYRRLVPASAQHGVQLLRRASESTLETVKAGLNGIQNGLRKTPLAKYHLAESWPTGSMVFWISALLATFLLLDHTGLGR